MTSGNVFLDRERNVISTERFAELSADPYYKIVKHDLVGDYCVVTGWRGFDPYRMPTEDGVLVNIFECIAFRRAKENEQGHRLACVEGMWTSADVHAWVPDTPTEAEAIEHHEKLVQMIRTKHS